MRHPFIRYIFILFVLATLGCVKKTSTKDNQTTQNQLQTTAKQFVAKGDYLGASQTYRKLANTAEKPAQRESYQASALEYLLRANRLDSVRRDLQQFKPQTPSVKTRVQLIQVQLALSDQQSQRAIDILQKIQPQTLGRNARRNYHTLFALSLDAQNKPILALYERLNLDAWLSPAQKTNNHQKIWQTLTQLTPTQLKTWKAPLPPHLRGWVALSLVSKTNRAGQIQRTLQDWRIRYPQHPANQGLVNQLAQGTTTWQKPKVGHVRHIALFLPLNGRFKVPAEMVRDGFFGAWYADQKQNKPSVKVYDVSQGNVETLYQTAIQNGAQMVVGPLGRKTATQLLRAYPEFPVPTLLLYEPNELNQRGMAMPKNLYQFSLSPETEARAVADKAWLDGHRLASAIVPDGNWGARMLQAFSQRWQELGGELLSDSSYNKKTLPNAVSNVARSGAHMAFVAAFPVDARRLLPQFKYYQARKREKMAIYATSHAYSADGDNKKNKDIEGLIIVDMPWILLKGAWQAPENLIQFRPKEAKTPIAETAAINNKSPEVIPVLQLPPPSKLYTQLQQHWPARMQGGNQRFFAFGVDIYAVIRYLQNLSQSADVKKLAGMTGLLSLNARGVIQREMLWANIRYGRTKLHYILPEPPMLEPTMPVLNTQPQAAH